MSDLDQYSREMLEQALLDSLQDGSPVSPPPDPAPKQSDSDEDGVEWEERLWRELPQELWDKVVMRNGVPGLHDSRAICKTLIEALYDPRIHKVRSRRSGKG